jgi:hypothetical protein
MSAASLGWQRGISFKARMFPAGADVDGMFSAGGLEFIALMAMG